MPGIAIQNLSKSYLSPDGQEVLALRDLTLQFAAGELIVLVGPSGSGKTTLLRLIAGLEEPSAGTISIDGRAVNGLAPHEREVSMAFQEHALYPHMTVGDNLAFGMKLRNVQRAEIERRTLEVAELLGIGGLLNRFPAAISGGERQRVALGRALVVAPKVLLLDEPLSNLDAPLRAEMRREIVRLHRRFAGTVLYVTHDQAEAMHMADRMVVLAGGRTQQVGRPMEVYGRPANHFVAGFIGSPPMNFFRGQLEREGETLWFQSHHPAGPCPVTPRQTRFRFAIDPAHARSMGAHVGRAVVLGLRPEHLQLIRAEAESQASGIRMEAALEWIELTGPEMHLYLRNSQGSFVVRAPAAAGASVGQLISVGLDIRQAHYFLVDDGAALH